MIKTVIVPKENTVHLSIPSKYIGKEIEVLLYAKDEVVETTTSVKKPSDFFGTLSEEEGEKFHSYLKQARQEWERDI